MIVIRLYRVIPLGDRAGGHRARGVPRHLVFPLALARERDPYRRVHTPEHGRAPSRACSSRFMRSSTAAPCSPNLRGSCAVIFRGRRSASRCSAGASFFAPSPGIPREGRADTPHRTRGRNASAPRAPHTPTANVPKTHERPRSGPFAACHVRAGARPAARSPSASLNSTGGVGAAPLAGRLAHHLHLHERHHELLLELRADELLVRIFHVALNDLLRLLVEGVRMVQGACHPSRCSRRAPANRPSSCGTPYFVMRTGMHAFCSTLYETLPT